jgi:hypothetical protein
MARALWEFDLRVQLAAIKPALAVFRVYRKRKLFLKLAVRIIKKSKLFKRQGHADTNADSPEQFEFPHNPFVLIFHT